MRQRDIERFVKGYLKRASETKMKVYPLDETGNYSIMGGQRYSGRDYENPHRNFIGVVNGRFIDVLVFAIQHEDYKSEAADCNSPEGRYHGYITKQEIIELEKSSTGNDLLNKINGEK